MINASMRLYDYFIYGERNAYGVPSLSARSKGKIKMAIEVSSQQIQDSITYQGCSYLGFTRDEINDTYVIQYGDERLKVKYVNPRGRFKQVYMERM